MKDIVRTRIMVEDLKYTEEASRAHGWRFACEGILPANTLGKSQFLDSPRPNVQTNHFGGNFIFLYLETLLILRLLVTAHIAGDSMLVEIEAWAEVGSSEKEVLRISK